jgi:diguanylate cyclase (GGDEF)-like protein/PAS domain S-box-containing protein
MAETGPSTTETQGSPASAGREADLLGFVVDLGACRTEDDIYRLAAQRIHRLVASDRLSIALLEPDGSTLRVAAVEGVSGYPALDAIVSADGTNLGAAIREGQQVVDDTSTSTTDDSAALARLGLRSTVVSPLTCPERTLGTINVASRERGAFPRQDVLLLARVGRIVGSAVERVRHAATAAQEGERLRPGATRRAELHRIELELLTVPTREEALHVIARAAQRLVPAVRVSYLGFGEDHRAARVWRLTGSDATLGESLRVAISEHSPLRSLGCGGLHYRPDTHRADRSEGQALPLDRVGSAVYLAVSTGDRVVGSLNVGVAEHDGIDEDEQALLVTLAGIAGVALERLDARQGAAESTCSTEMLLHALIDDCPVMLAALDAEGTVTRVSQLGASRLGYTAEELVGRPYAALHPADEWGALGERVGQLADPSARESGRLEQWDIRMATADGRALWTRQYGRHVAGPDGESMLLLSCEDISELRALHDQLDYQAEHDALTGAANRAVLEAQLEALDNAYVARGTLLLIDIDHFKLINDRLGHRAGDDLLRRITSEVRREMDDGDLLARVGADEFALFSPDRDLHAAIRLGQRLVAAVAPLGDAGSFGSPGPTISVGVAGIAQGIGGPEDLIASADAACYAAKVEGGGRVVAASETSETQRMRRSASSWIDRIRKALAHDGFQLYGQPIEPLDVEVQPAFEVLLRLEGDLGQPVPPGAFTPFAEAYSLASQIDLWVIARTLSALADTPARARCFINISGASLDDGDFIDSVARMVRESPVPGAALTFEITETVAARYADRTRAFVEELRGLGCWLALDDFGSGYSSLSQLSDLPADVLKIDGVLVRDIAEDPRSLALLRSIAGMGRALGMRTVAEHVETQEVLSALRSVGVDWAQGYHLGMPEPLGGLLGRYGHPRITAGRRPARLRLERGGT